MASTTSTRDSGLLDLLIPIFEDQYDCRVDLIAVGTGAALKLGEQGDVDVLLCHAPAAEESFMKLGYGDRRELVMMNFFVIVGPHSDPANARGSSARRAFRNIYNTSANFVSRGDQSGTHMRESKIWQECEIDPDWASYMETGQGQGRSLIIADEKKAYMLTDKATWLKQKNRLALIPLVESDALLANPYSVITVGETNHERIQIELANQFAEFMISQPIQQKIGEYRLENEMLFIPARLKTGTSN